MGRGLMRGILEGIRKKQEDSELQMYATEPPGAMGEDDGESTSFEGWMKKLDALFSAKLGLSIHDVEDMPFRDWYDSGMSPEEAFPDVMDQMRSEHGERDGLFDAKNAPPGENMEFTIDESGPLDENEWMTLDEMELECTECADKMRERKMTRILRREAEGCKAKYDKVDEGIGDVARKVGRGALGVAKQVGRGVKKGAGAYASGYKKARGAITGDPESGVPIGQVVKGVGRAVKKGAQAYARGYEKARGKVLGLLDEPTDEG